MTLENTLGKVGKVSAGLAVGLSEAIYGQENNDLLAQGIGIGIAGTSLTVGLFTYARKYERQIKNKVISFCQSLIRQ